MLLRTNSNTSGMRDSILTLGLLIIVVICFWKCTPPKISTTTEEVISDDTKTSTTTAVNTDRVDMQSLGAFGDGVTDVTDCFHKTLNLADARTIYWSKSRRRYRTQRLKVPNNVTIIFNKDVETGAYGEVDGLCLLSEVSKIKIFGIGATLIQSLDSRRSMIYINDGENNLFEDFTLRGT